MLRTRLFIRTRRHPGRLVFRIRRVNSGEKSIFCRKNGYQQHLGLYSSWMRDGKIAILRPMKRNFLSVLGHLRPFRRRLTDVASTILITGSLVLFLSALAHGAQAVQYISKEGFIEQNIPAGSELFEEIISLEKKEQDTLARRINLPSVPASVPFVLGNDKEGALTGAVSFLVLHGAVYRGYHHIGVALNPDGTIKTVAVMDLKAEKPQEVAIERFLGQFANKSSKTLRPHEDINAVSGATESSLTVLIAVKVVVAVFLKYVKAPP